MTRLVYFTQSLVTCWNNGNAHFLRGVLRALRAQGHEVRAYEPRDGWSRRNLRRDHGPAALDRFNTDFPDLVGVSHFVTSDPDAMLDGADVVIVHEWNDPKLVAAIGRRRKQGARFTLLFHDTHHRAVSDPAAIEAFDLSGYDAILAFGETLAKVYRRQGWGERAYVWHEAADTSLFRPSAHEETREGVVWIGNWGDDERGEELRGYLLDPAREAGLPLDIHGVRYPQEARSVIAASGARYCGWLANADAPAVFARHLMTVHVPRRFYATHLPGIPTIRVFEALACGIPLICAPWRDAEALFEPGRDYLMANNADEMRAHMRALANDAGLRAALARHGLATIVARHTCVHRARELLAIVAALDPAPIKEVA